MLIRRFFAFVVSLFILFSLPLNAANAASSWSITGAVSAGARSVVNATKSGYKSAVNIAPTAGRLGTRLIKGANTAALAYAVVQILGDGVDWVLDPDNNAVKYKDKIPLKTYYYSNSHSYPNDAAVGDADPVVACKKIIAHNNSVNGWKYAFHSIGGSVGSYKCNMTNGYQASMHNHSITDPNDYKYLPIDTVAAKVISNANSSHSASQAATRETATEMVVGGQFDQDLLAGAVPINDTRPLVPSVPISGNGNVTHGESWEGGDGVSGATPGQQADAAKDAADASKKAAQAAADAAKAAAEDARKAADDAQDLINSGADTAAIDAATAAAEAAAQAAADAKAAADAAVAAANDRAAAAERAAEAATQAAADAAIQAAKDLADAIAAGDAAAVAAADAAKAAADAAVADAKAKQAAAEKAAEKAKAEAQKPFELPPFCSWAAPVCDFIDWFKEPPPADLPAGDVPFATTGDVGLDEVDRFEKRIDFTGQCPVNDFSFTMMGVTYAKPIPYHHLCGFLEQIAPWLLAMCYLGVAYFVVENI